MNIAVIAANGKVGQLVVKEALDAGFDVTAFARGENKSAAKNFVQKEVSQITKEDLAGFDVVVDAVGGWTAETVGNIPAAAEHLVKVLEGSETRLIVVGGAGSLFVNPEHTATVDMGENFPEAWLPISHAHAKALAALRASKTQWTYISPAADFRADEPKSGKWIWAGEDFTLNSRNESILGYADYAAALIEEIKNKNAIGKRVSLVRA